MTTAIRIKIATHVLLAAVVATDQYATAFNSFPSLTCGGGNIHEEITRVALKGFNLCPEALSRILNENTQQDRRDFTPPTIPLKPNLLYRPEFHFDRSPLDGPLPAAYIVAFKRGQRYVHDQEVLAVGAISHGDTFIALDAIADGLHAVQDFFSHTNYVDFDDGSPDQLQAQTALFDGISDPPTILKVTGYSSQGENPTGDPYPHGSFSKDCPRKNDEAEANGNKKYMQARAAAIDASIAFVTSIKSAVSAERWSNFVSDCTCGFSAAFSTASLIAPTTTTGATCPVHPLQGPVEIVTSNDPNDKNGSQGTGSQHYLTNFEPLRYSIYFDNTKDADPAQDVLITDSLDKTRVDLSTVALGPITFANTVITPPSTPLAVLKSFSKDVDLRPNQNLIARVTASLDPNKAVLSWHFESIDTLTGQPTDDPRAGFLLAGADGSVLFTAQSQSGLPTNTDIPNTATVSFDGKPLPTPTWSNKLDNTPPVSKISPLGATQNASNFAVNWSGTDEGAGVRDYTVSVSDNQRAFTPWLTNVTQTSAIYAGTPGHSYGFFVIARDLVGNTEAAKKAAEATTTVPLNPSCASDYSGQIAVTQSGFRFDRSTQKFLQTVTLINTSLNAIPGPVSVALDGLSPTATLANAAGTTSCSSPAGSAFSTVPLDASNPLASGQTIVTTLEFTTQGNAGISYTPRVLAGPQGR